jgi:anti-sigma regulatory factor (Ser/Thr protein kinase)
MAMLSASLHALRDAEDSPSRLLVRLDAQFAGSLRPGTFVTMFYGILDPATNRMVWASAGHNPMLIYRRADGSVERSDSRGIPIGALRRGLIEKTLVDQTLQLEPGDIMVQCTDGYTEAIHADTRELFGLDRLADVVQRNGRAGVQSVIAAAIDAVHEWTRGGVASDDETLLVVGVDPDPALTTPAGDGRLEPLAALAEARARGMHTELDAATKTGPAIMRWLRTLAGLEHLGEDDFNLLGTAMMEVCDNIAEHGYEHHAGERFELWWVPPRNFPPDPSESAAATAQRRVRAGWFVVRDRARAYQPGAWTPTDFNDRHARTRGRGYGLDIIHRVMKRVEYVADTPEGNVTVLAFGARQEDAERNAR